MVTKAYVISCVVVVVPAVVNRPPSQQPRVSASASSAISSDDTAPIARGRQRADAGPAGHRAEHVLHHGLDLEVAAHEQGLAYLLADLLADHAHHGAGRHLPDQRIAAEQPP